MAKRKTSEKSSNKSTPLPQGAANAITDNEHAKLIKWVNESDDATTDSRALAEKSRSYYDSVQWNAAEVTKLKAQKQAATVINRIKPKIDSLMGMERANRTTAKAMPRTPKETGGANAATEAVRFCLQDNMFERSRSDAWENLLIEGTAGIEIIVKPKKGGKDGDYKVILRQIMWDRLIYDAHSRRKDFSDARFLGQVVWMDYDEAAALYPNAKDILLSMQSTSSTYDDRPKWMDAGRRRVKIVELYYKRDDGDWWYACFTRGGYCEEPKKSPYLNEEDETESAYEFASLFVDRDGGRYGAEKQLLDVQDEINKRRSKALHLMSVRQVRWERGAVEDINKARAELAKPDGVLETTPGMEFEILKTGDMAQAQFNLLAEAKAEIDAVGANSATMGKDHTRQSGVALRQRAMAGQTELAPMFDMLKNLDIRVYRKTWNRIKQYWKSEIWLRVTDDENNLKFVGLNKPISKGDQILKQAEEQGANPQQLQMLQQQIAADPTMSQTVDTHNQITEMDVDIIMDDAPDTVTQEVEDFQAMAEMVKSGFPIPPEAVIMASPLSNKDKILKMMKESPQIPPKMQEQMKQQQEAMQKMGEELQATKQENVALKADTQGEQAKLALSAQESQAKHAQRQAEAQAEIQLKRETQTAELQLERERAAATIQLEREKAEAALHLQAMKQKGEADNQSAKLAFDQDCRAKDETAKMQERAKAEEAPLVENALPTFVATIQKISADNADGLKAVAEAIKMMAQAIQQNAKKTVSLGNIERNEDGMLTGASATVQ